MAVGVLLVVLAALCWGVTNPFIARGAGAGGGSQSATARPGLASAVLGAFTRLAFILPFAVNQAGSVLCTAAMASLPTSIVQPVANSLTLAVTAVTSSAMGLPTGRPTVVGAGLALIAVGAWLCAADG
ncbi:hypothetical protein FNF31_07566 [Cafeteria roenbergensis]|uniref:EamA domain-containing protein n=1 Tax=Cafeteria roenbergensis TaxID=33653 RepID=A0A5A8C3C7_CAFRO|nr:hypothetical protein FNF31_07566 [Cafeteria roenbergensis]